MFLHSPKNIVYTYVHMYDVYGGRQEVIALRHCREVSAMCFEKIKTPIILYLQVRFTMALFQTQTRKKVI